MPELSWHLVDNNWNCKTRIKLITVFIPIQAASQTWAQAPPKLVRHSGCNGVGAGVDLDPDPDPDVDFCVNPDFSVLKVGV